MGSKEQLRRDLLARRDRQPEGVWRAASLAVREGLLASGLLAGASRVHAFASFGREVDTWGVIADLLAAGTAVFLPRVMPGGRLESLRVRSTEGLARSRFGILEPPPGGEDGGLSYDLILVPGLAFDPDGYRLGFGGGYYDRFLSGATGYRLGLAFDWQRLGTLPREAHDRPVDAVLTETGLHPATAAGRRPPGGDGRG